MDENIYDDIYNTYDKKSHKKHSKKYYRVSNTCTYDGFYIYKHISTMTDRELFGQYEFLS
jgi:hypothetical protein